MVLRDALCELLLSCKPIRACILRLPNTCLASAVKTLRNAGASPVGNLGYQYMFKVLRTALMKVDKQHWLRSSCPEPSESCLWQRGPVLVAGSFQGRFGTAGTHSPAVSGHSRCRLKCHCPLPLSRCCHSEGRLADLTLWKEFQGDSAWLPGKGWNQGQAGTSKPWV